MAGLLSASVLLAGMATSDAATPTLSTAPVAADAYVSSFKPNSNFGSANTVQVDASPILSGYLRFDVPAFEGTVTSASLRVYVSGGSASGFEVRSVSESGWAENTITFANAPPFGEVVASSGPVSTGFRELNVTPLVTGGGPISLALTTTGSTEVRIGSREGLSTRRPSLTVETLDTTAPTVGLSVPAQGATVGLTPTLSGAAGTAPGDSNQVTVKLYAGGSATGTPVQTLSAAAAGGSWSVTASPALAPGTYTAQAEQSDQAGNVGRSPTRTFTAAAPTDTTPPTVGLSVPAQGATVGLTPTLSGAAGTAPGDSNQVTVKLYAGGSATGTPVQTLSAAAAGGSWSVTASPALAPGTYTAQAEQSDQAGNVGRSPTRTFTAAAPTDTTPPTVGLSVPAQGATVGLTPTLSGAAGTAPGDSNQVTVKLYAGGSATGTPVQTLSAAAAGGSWSVTASPALAPGTYTAQAEQSDQAGNVGRSPTRTFTAAAPTDTTPPTVGLSVPAQGATVGLTPTLSGAAGTAPGDSNQVTVKLYAGGSATGTPVQTLSAAAAGGSWSVTASPALAPGTYTAQAEQSDAAGNVGTSGAHTFTVADAQLPSYRAEVLADTPRAYWRLGEASGIVARNEITTADGEYRGGFTLGLSGAPSSDANTAASFNGTSGTVRALNSPSLNPTGGLTIETWVRPASLSVASSLLRKEGQYLLRLQPGGGVTFRVWKGGVTREFSTALGTVEANAWNHVVATWNGSTMGTWVNGTLRGTMALAAPIDAGTSQPLYLASSYQSYDWFAGRLDEVAIYDRALAGSRIQAHYAAAATADTTPPQVSLLSPGAASTMDPLPNFGGAAGTAPGDSNQVTVKLYAGGSATGTPVQTLSAPLGAHWGPSFSVTPAQPLAPGTYTAQAEQSDQAGNMTQTQGNTFTVVPAGDPTILAAGDIAACDSTGDEATAALLDRLPGIVVPLGDLVYEDGTAAQFADCYGPNWGRHRARTRPVVGGHDYRTPGAAPYYNYFGAAAGDPSKGYYSYDLGTWHVVALNVECTEIGGCWYGDPEEQWLRADLAAHPSACTVALIHAPRFSSGSIHGDNPEMEPFWQALYERGADVVLSGDDHTYERFAPQTPTGAADPSAGIREFVLGTGGRSHYAFGAIRPNSQVRNNDTFGVLSLTLHPGSYEWRFVPEAGRSFTDTGQAACH